MLQALGYLCKHFGALVTHTFMLCATLPSTALPPGDETALFVPTNDTPTASADVANTHTATHLIDLAQRAFEAGRTETAATHLLRAIELREKELGDTHPQVALALHDLARVRLAQKDPARAALSIRTAMDILEDQVGLEDPIAMGPMFTIAQVRLAEGNIAASVWWLNRILKIQEGNDEPFGALGATEEDVHARTRVSDQTMDAAVTLHVIHAPHDTAAAQLAFSAVLRRKERVFETRMQALSALRRVGSDGRALASELQAAQSKLAKVVVKGPGNLPMEEYRARVAAMDGIRKDLELQLGPRGASGYLAGARPDVEVVRQALPERAALVEFMLYRPTLDVQSKYPPPPRYAAYVLRKSGGLSFVDLGEARLIDSMITHVRSIFSNPQQDPIPLARALGDRIMAPILALIGNAKRILVAPDGNLSLLPLGALRDEHGWYIDRFEFTYLSTGRELIRTGTQRPPRQNTVILAAPDFDHAAPTRAMASATRGVRRAPELGDVRFPPLEHAEAEARQIHALMPATRIFVGAEASEVLVKQLQGPEILHLATHGFYLRNAPKPRQRQNTPARDVWEDGFLRGGLAFAGANQHENEQEDGVLTALEASTLDLEGTKLVVLSGCETGVGEVQARDGVRGLRHAFFMAGAQTLVTSLWPVDDEATQRLMVSYYRALSSGQGRSEALRTAARETKRDPETKHPYVWAGFIVLGNGSRLDGTWTDPRTIEEAPTRNIAFEKPAPIRPGPRGCACRAVDQDHVDGKAGASLLLAAAWLRTRRRHGTRRLHERKKGVTKR